MFPYVSSQSAWCRNFDCGIATTEDALRLACEGKNNNFTFKAVVTL